MDVRPMLTAMRRLMAPGFGRLWAASVLLPAIGLAAAGWWTWNNVLTSTCSEMARTEDMVHEQVQRALETHEAVLAAMEAYIAGMDWDEIHNSRAAYAFARRIDGASPTIRTLGVVDPQGMLALGSDAPFPAPRLNLSDRPYVRRFPAGTAERTTYIGAAIVSRLDGTVQVYASRPRRGPDDTPDGGVVAASFSPSFFERFFGAAAQSAATGFSIVRDDGKLIANFPEPVSQEDEALPAADPRHDAIPRAGALPLDGRQVVFLKSGSLLTGLHLLAASRVRPYALTVLHQLDPHVIRDDWLQQMITPTLSALAAMALLLLLTARAQARTQQERALLVSRMHTAEAAQRLAQQQAELEARLRQNEKVAALGQLAAGVAHDFNNLLQTIVLNADLLGQAPDATPATKRNAGLIIKASERGVALTRRMLDFARTEEGTRPEQTRLDIATALANVTELLRTSLARKYRLHLSIDSGGVPDTHGDAAEFESVVINLVINARDAMPQGGDITLHADTLTDTSGRHTRIAVQDHGNGMDEATLARAGEAFFTTKARGQGTGLGLSMARGFARRAGGSLHIDSQVNKGTTITLLLPAL